VLKGNSTQLAKQAREMKLSTEKKARMIEANRKNDHRQKTASF
jgi:hypothetical protein